MKQKTLTSVAGMVFSIVAVLHLLRLLLHWEVVIGGWTVPLWVSWMALALSGYLAYSAFTVSK